VRIKNAIGIGMCAAPFVAIFAYVVNKAGWLEAIVGVAAIAALGAFIAAGVWLATSE